MLDPSVQMSSFVCGIVATICRTHGDPVSMRNRLNSGIASVWGFGGVSGIDTKPCKMLVLMVFQPS
jgi:hypothetical protein